jgi:hypothetical protein
MGDRKTVRITPLALVGGLIILIFAVISFVDAFAADDKNRFYADIFYGLIFSVTSVVVIVMYFMLKYEYDENGFLYTNVFGRKREVSYDEIFSLMMTTRNTLRIELKDGAVISVSTFTKPSKEFVQVIKSAYMRNSQQNNTNQMYNR